MDNLLEKYIQPENNLFQSDLWEKYQRLLGHKIFWIDCNEHKVLLVKIPLFKNFSYLYCPRAPQVETDCWYLFLNKAGELAKMENCVFLRVEPMKVPNGILKKLNFKKVGKYSPLSKQFSPMSTLLLDISKPEEKLLEEMKPKWRYNIKLAQKKGVSIRQSQDLVDLKAFYKLSVGMQKRGYHSFDFEHYARLVESLSKNMTMFVAEEGKEILSVLLVTFYGKTAIYLHGASSDHKRELMPNHLAQWEAIKEAKVRGCEIYDFWGAAPEGEENHDWAGITRFKLGFGGERVQFLGAFDYTFSRKWYTIFCLANFIRKIVKK